MRNVIAAFCLLVFSAAAVAQAPAAACPCKDGCKCKTAPGGLGTCGSFLCPANGGARPLPAGYPPAPPGFEWRPDARGPDGWGLFQSIIPRSFVPPAHPIPGGCPTCPNCPGGVCPVRPRVIGP